VLHGEDFSKLIDYLDAELTRLILGQTLTTRGAEQGVGTQALGQVHENLMYQIIKRDAKGLDEVVNEQLLRPWGLWTFGEKFLERALKPTFSVNLMPEHDAMEQATLLSKVRGMIDIPLEEAHARFQIRRPEEGEELIKESMLPLELGGGFGAGA
jgi:phage gp29-like protein